MFTRVFMAKCEKREYGNSAALSIEFVMPDYRDFIEVCRGDTAQDVAHRLRELATRIEKHCIKGEPL